MKNLPLLSSSFPYFSWETQFNNATSAQLQSGYTALTSGGKTTEFHRFIWNDMVDLLSRAISDAGLTWDNTYGTAQETKVLEKYGAFTARKFNAITINIDQVIKNAWRWEVDQLFIGYVKRARFYGIAEKDDKGDYLYGQFIIELARVLNQFIAILKNEADFADFVIREHSSTPTQTTTLPRKSAPMRYGRSSYTIPISEVLRKQSRPIYSSLYSSSKTRAEALSKAIKGLTHKASSKALYGAKMNAPHVARASYRDISKAPYDGTANAPKAGRMASSNKSKADYQTSMNKPQVELLEHQEIATAPYEVEALAREKMTIASEDTIASSVYTDVIVGKPKFPIHEESSETTTDTKVEKGNPKYLIHAESSKTTKEVELETPTQAKFVPRLQKSMSTSVTRALRKTVLNLDAKIKSSSKVSTFLSFDGIEDLWALQEGTNLHIYQVYDGYKETSDLYIDMEMWLAPIQNGSDLFIQQIYDASEMKGE